jgi:hypothetical protein
MGEKLPFGGIVFLPDGTKICEVEEIPEFIETTPGPEDAPQVPMLNLDHEITGTFTMNPTLLRTFRRVLLGWTAKGPLRWRQVRKAMMTLFRR